MKIDPAVAGRRVLVVEDEILVGMFIEDVLERLGCTVVGPVGRVEEALALIDGQEIDAATLDLNLGENADSYPIAEVLAARGVPFLFLTGYGQNGLHEGFRDRPLIAKPFRDRDLARILASIFATP